MADSPIPSDVRAVFEAHLEVLDRLISFVASRHHLRPQDAEEFASYVRLRLIEEDYHILRQHSGRSSFRTYLTVVVQRMLLDYEAQHWGKWRPSAEARRSGETAVLLERLMMRDGHSFDEACQILRTNYSVPFKNEELEQIAEKLPVRHRRRTVGVAVLDTLAAPAQSDPTESHTALAHRVASVLEQGMRELAVMDRLILKMKFHDGFTANEIGPVVGLPARAVYARIERLLANLRTLLERQGIERRAVEVVAANPCFAVEFPDEALGILRPGPSIEEGQ